MYASGFKSPKKYIDDFMGVSMAVLICNFWKILHGFQVGPKFGYKFRILEKCSKK